ATRRRAPAANAARRSYKDFDHERFNTHVIRVGSLEAVEVGDILYKLFASKTTGRLDIVHREQTRRIYIRDGVPVYAASEAPSEQLEASLVKQGVLSLPDLHRAKRHMGQRTLSETLLALDMLTPEQLLVALDRQVSERIMSCFKLRSGNFAFHEETDWIAQVQHFPQNVVELICEGVRRHTSSNEIAQSLGMMLDKFVVPTDKYEAFLPYLPDADQHQAMLKLIDGRHNLQHITQK